MQGPRRHSADNGSRSDIFGHHGVCLDDGTVADMDATDDCCARANVDVVPQHRGSTVAHPDRRTVLEAAVVPDHRSGIDNDTTGGNVAEGQASTDLDGIRDEDPVPPVVALAEESAYKPDRRPAPVHGELAEAQDNEGSYLWAACQDPAPEW